MLGATLWHSGGMEQMGEPTARYSMIGVGGRRLRAAEWHADAPADRAPLLLLTGIGMNLELFEPVAAAFPGRRIVGFDMPGIGGSPDPIMPYTMPSMALVAAAVLDHFGIEQADIMGMSWGGALAQQFAFQHRHRTRRLVLVATSAGVTMVPGNLAVLRHLLDPREYTVEKALKRNLAALYNGGGSDEPVSLNAARPPSPLGWSYQLAAFSLWSSLPFLPLLDLPVLVMGGEDDQIVPPANVRALACAIPRARLEMFERGGHLFLLSQRARFTRLLGEFLDSPQAGE